MTKYFFAGLALLSLYCASGQQLTQTIKGQILDEQSRSPVIGATVVVLGSNPILGSTSDVDGYFKIPNVPIGRHTLDVRSIGYESATLSEILVGSGKEVVLNISLVESILQMNEVVVVADEKTKGEPLNELASVSAISISVEETSRYAATFDDPARAALTYAGVTTGGDDLLNEIVIRGNSSKGILWRMEGVEIPNPNHFGSVGSSAGGISMLSNNVLANSDFFTGAFSPQYGNATSGIFDLQMRKGNTEQHEHAVQVGLLGVGAASEGPINREKRSSYIANYRYSTLALLENIGLGILGDQEHVSFQDLSFKIHSPTEKFGSFSFWGLGGRNTYTYRPDDEIDDVYYEDEMRGMGVMGLTNVYFLNPNTFVESVISGSYSSYRYDADSLRLQVVDTEIADETTYRMSSFVNHKFNAMHTLRVGGIVSNLRFNYLDRNWIREEDRYINGVDNNGQTFFYQYYANWQMRPTENLTINTGFHGSVFALNGKKYLEPRLGFRWRVGDQFITGGAGLHSRMETLVLYQGQHEQQDGTFRQLNKNLGFTRAAHYVLGYERRLSDHVRFKAEAYYQYLFDVPVYGGDSTIAEYTTFSALNTYDGYVTEPLVNKGKGKNYGLELTLERFFYNNFYMMTTASLYESTYTGIDGVWRDTRFNGNFIFNVIGGKEFKVGKSGNNSIGFNTRFIYAGGKRQAPVLLQESENQGYTAYDYANNFKWALTNYYRIDLGINYRKNKENSAQILAFSVQNVSAVQNEYERYYSPVTGRIESASQLSFFPNFSYRWEF